VDVARVDRGLAEAFLVEVTAVTSDDVLFRQAVNWTLDHAELARVVAMCFEDGEGRIVVNLFSHDPRLSSFLRHFENTEGWTIRPSC
jgi:hypothetical protein